MSPAPGPGRTELHEEAYDVMEKEMKECLYIHTERYMYMYMCMCMYMYVLAG